MKKAILFGCLTLFFACSKESNENNCTDPTLLQKIQLNNYNTQVISYGESCRIKETTEPFVHKNFIFNGKNQLEKIEEKMSFDALSCYMPTGAAGETFADPRKAKITSYITIEYKGDGTIEKKNYFSNYADSYKLVRYEKYNYLNSRVNKTERYNPKDELIDYTTYDYDENGNVQWSAYYLVVFGKPELRTTTNYQYDNKQNPFRVFAMVGTPGKYTNTNNIVSEKQVSYYNGKQSEYVINYTYEYNELGYPSKANEQKYVYGN